MYFKIMSGKHGGSGSFLCPPGHPAITHSLYGWGSKSWATRGGVNSARYIGGIEALLEDDWAAHEAGPVLRGQARRLFEQFNATKALSELWVQSVYAYFAHSYSPDGTNRNVSDAISTSKLHCACGGEFWNQKGLNHHYRTTSSERLVHYEITKPLPPDEHHLGYLLVKQYFPDHEPRHDLIENPVSTTGTCVHCGQGVQYEARKDALCVAMRGGSWVYDETCPDSETGHSL
jgi:hypothetical protein